MKVDQVPRRRRSEEARKPAVQTPRITGADRGCADAVALGDGTRIRVPEHPRLEARALRSRRERTQCARGSRRWGAWRACIVSALEAAGGTLADLPAMDSSRTCARCGYVDAKSREGKHFECTASGHAEDAAVNAREVLGQRAEHWTRLRAEGKTPRRGKQRTVEGVPQARHAPGRRQRHPRAVGSLRGREAAGVGSA